MPSRLPVLQIMILIGQYDSPFVRRVGIALYLYGIAFEHRPWSTFADAEKIRPYNPLTRVPTLVLGSGEVLIESHLMLDYLDQQVRDDQVLCPRTGPQRHQVLKIAALASGLADKAVSLFYEQRLHQTTSDTWEQRCRAQILGTAQLLERERAARHAPHWFGAAITHADIAVAAALRFANEAHPALLPMAQLPALAADCAKIEALPAFQAIQQTFIPPA